MPLYICGLYTYLQVIPCTSKHMTQICIEQLEAHIMNYSTLGKVSIYGNLNERTGSCDDFTIPITIFETTFPVLMTVLMLIVLMWYETQL